LAADAEDEEILDEKTADEIALLLAELAGVMLVGDDERFAGVSEPPPPPPPQPVNTESTIAAINALHSIDIFILVTLFGLMQNQNDNHIQFKGMRGSIHTTTDTRIF
jgi:hypothetical protein